MSLLCKEELLVLLGRRPPVDILEEGLEILLSILKRVVEGVSTLIAMFSSEELTGSESYLLFKWDDEETP